MEKLKCSSCGGDIVVDDDKEYGTCPHCGTKYKLNKDINFNIRIDDNTKEVLNEGYGSFSRLSILIIIPIVAFIVFGIVIFSMNAVDSKNNLHNKYKQDTEEKDNSFEKNVFNLKFIGSNGTQNDFFLKHIFDNIIESNKTNDRKIVLVFDGKEVTEENEIIEIKHSLSGDYEVSLNYDNEGFINKIVVNKIN